MLRLIASATTRPSRAMTVPKGYSPSLTAMRESSMQRAIIALSVASREGSMSTASPICSPLLPNKDIYQYYYATDIYQYHYVFQRPSPRTQVVFIDASAMVAYLQAQVQIK
jgi:hypothetical protein